ncbi:MAG: hypothetical protein QW478_05250, partial [Candidatus Micrarchaeaceae archaeon]
PKKESESLIKYSEKALKYFGSPKKEMILKYIKYLYLNDVDSFIKQSYKIKLASYFVFFLGVILFMSSVILVSDIFIIFGLVIFFFGLILLMFPFDILSFLIQRNMKSEEKKIYIERYDILRQLYYNIKVFNEAYYITDSVKTNPVLHKLLVALKSDEKPAFYEKFLNITKLFTNQDLISFFKTVSEKLKEYDFGQYYEQEQEENSNSYKNVVKEKATIKQSMTTMLLLGLAMIGLFIGIGSVLQHLLTGIYNGIIKTVTVGIATTSISSVLSIFQLLTTLPNIAYGYILLVIIAIIIIYKIKVDSQEMFG